MTFALAFNGLTADAPRQRARCAATGRFVAWSKVPQLRVPGAPRVVVIASPLVVVAADGAEAAPVAPAAEVAPVAIVDGAEADAAPPVVAALLNSARAAGASLVDGARSLVAAGGLSPGGWCPCRPGGWCAGGG